MNHNVKKNNVPKVGILPVMDPRIDPDLEKKLLSELYLEEKIRALGVEVVSSGRAFSNEESAIQEVHRLREQGVSGIIYYTMWFLRANVIVGACQHSNLPAMVWSIPSMDNASTVGFGVTHGSLDEVGFEHEVICGRWNEGAKRKMLAWIRACHVKKIVAQARYGHIGGRCLSMMTAETDPNQLRWQFGLDVDHAEQWTLIHEAEKIPDDKARHLMVEWKRDFASVEVSDDILMKSAKLYLAGSEMFAKNQWDFVGIKCQFELIDNYVSPCLPIAIWNDEGFVAACETDINAALTMFVLNTLSREPVMFSDIQYLDPEEKWARFLNCGTAATKLAGGKNNVQLKNCPELQGTYDEKTGTHLCKGGACPHFILPPGEVTLARFGRIKGRYVLHLTNGESFEYPHDRAGFEGIAGVWPFAYVKIHQDIPAFIQNLRAHHICIAFGDWIPELEMLAKMWHVDIL